MPTTRPTPLSPPLKPSPYHHKMTINLQENLREGPLLRVQGHVSVLAFSSDGASDYLAIGNSLGRLTIIKNIGRLAAQPQFLVKDLQVSKTALTAASWPTCKCKHRPVWHSLVLGNENGQLFKVLITEEVILKRSCALKWDVHCFVRLTTRVRYLTSRRFKPILVPFKQYGRSSAAIYLRM